VGLLVWSCAQPEAVMRSDEADVAAIREAHRAMQAASRRADWETWSAMYAEDAIVMAPNRPALEGRAAIGAHFSGWPAFGGEGVELLEVETRGDLAFVRGRYRLRMSIAGVGEVADSGKTLEIWRKQAGGEWRPWRDMSSSDVAPAR
jgi:ketosteroid isomerase-like protein